MTNKEFIERLKNADLIYETDENGNVVITKTAAEIFKNHFEQLEKDLEILEILKSSLMLIENKQMTFGYGKCHLAIRPDVILNDDAIQIIKEWLENDK